MQNINTDDGLKRFTINGDENRVIEFNPNDLNLITRLSKAQKDINEFIKLMPNKDALNSLNDDDAIEAHIEILAE